MSEAYKIASIKVKIVSSYLFNSCQCKSCPVQSTSRLIPRASDYSLLGMVSCWSRNRLDWFISLGPSSGYAREGQVMCTVDAENPEVNWLAN